MEAPPAPGDINPSRDAEGHKERLWLGQRRMAEQGRMGIFYS